MDFNEAVDIKCVAFGNSRWGTKKINVQLFHSIKNIWVTIMVGEDLGMRDREMITELITEPEMPSTINFSANPSPTASPTIDFGANLSPTISPRRSYDDDLFENISFECISELVAVDQVLVANLCNSAVPCDDYFTSNDVSHCVAAGSKDFILKVGESCKNEDLKEANGAVSCVGNSCTTEEFQTALRNSEDFEGCSIAVTSTISANPSPTASPTIYFSANLSPTISPRRSYGDDLFEYISFECISEPVAVDQALVANLYNSAVPCDDYFTSNNVSHCVAAGGKGFILKVGESCKNEDLKEANGAVSCVGNSCTTEEFQTALRNSKTLKVALLQSLLLSATVIQQ